MVNRSLKLPRWLIVSNICIYVCTYIYNNNKAEEIVIIICDTYPRHACAHVPYVCRRIIIIYIYTYTYTYIHTCIPVRLIWKSYFEYVWYTVHALSRITYGGRDFSKSEWDRGEIPCNIPSEDYRRAFRRPSLIIISLHYMFNAMYYICKRQYLLLTNFWTNAIFKKKYF